MAARQARQDNQDLEEDETEKVFVHESDVGEADEGHKEDQEDERIAAGDDEEGGGGQDDATRKANRAKARKARKEHRRERETLKDERIAQLEQALESVRADVGATKQNITTQNVAMVDQRLNECNQAIALSEQAMAKAVKAGDDEGFMAAMRTRDAARDAQGQLNAYKQASAHESQRQPQTQAVDGRVMDHAKEFAKDNPWFDMNPNTTDRDSRLVFELDKAVKRAGYDEKTALYWEELQERVDSKLPHRLEEVEDTHANTQVRQRDNTSQRRGPALGGGRSSRTGGKGEDVLVPKSVKQAAIDAGYWNDPKERADFLRRYKESVERHKGAR